MRAMSLDLATVVDRRHALKFLGGLGLLALGACSADDTASSGSTTTSTTSTTARTSTSDGPSSTTTTTGASLEPIPEETAGPYPGDGSNGPNVLDDDGVVRRDITSSFGSMSGTADGVPLAIELTILDAARGTAIPGAAVHLWHCDREGRYSLYSSGVASQNFLRGVQVADAQGRVTFSSIFPGAYAGRWPHIHFEVYPTLSEATSSGTPRATSQLALPEDACEVVYATAGYEPSVRNLSRTSLDRDNVFSDDRAEHQLAAVEGSVAGGYTASLSVPV
jgi:protocatechuate 3,4-dioxygenase beta subunit